MKIKTIFLYLLLIIIVNFTGYFLEPTVQKSANLHNVTADLIIVAFGLCGIFILVFHFVKFLQNKSWKLLCCGVLLCRNIFFWLSSFSKIECFQCSQV
jgi:predicted MFS family arabinose efflux permease